jgi:DNA replication protein DnaC
MTCAIEDRLDLEALLRRLHLPTVRRLHAELEGRAEEEKLSYRQYLTILMAEEVAHRTQTRIQRAVRRARFPFLKTIDEFDWTFQASIEQRLLGSYLGPELVTEGRGVVFCGPTGTGKTSLSIAIAYRAIQNGFDALFTTANDLIHDLSVAGREGRLAQALHPLTHVPVLVIDEVGYLVHPPDAANVLFQVVNERYLKRRPMIFTTNKPMESWGQVLHDQDLAEAILDRVLERGRVIHLRGPSYRTRHLAAKPSPQGDRTRIEGFPRRPGPGEGGKPRPQDSAIISGKSVQEYLEPTTSGPSSFIGLHPWCSRGESNPVISTLRGWRPGRIRRRERGAPARSRTGTCEVEARRASATPRGRKRMRCAIRLAPGEGFGPSPFLINSQAGYPLPDPGMEPMAGFAPASPVYGTGILLLDDTGGD